MSRESRENYHYYPAAVYPKMKVADHFLGVSRKALRRILEGVGHGSEEYIKIYAMLLYGFLPQDDLLEEFQIKIMEDRIYVCLPGERFRRIFKGYKQFSGDEKNLTDIS